MTHVANTAKITQVQRQLRARSSRSTRNAPLLWLCGLLLVALTVSRHLVVCQHQDGDTHIEFDHPTGCAAADGGAAGGHHACTCGGHGGDHDHDLVGAGDTGGTGDTGGESPADCDPHDSCTHTDLLVDVGPEQRSDTFELPTLPPRSWPRGSLHLTIWQTRDRPTLHPPGTGPPRGPTRFLLQHATTLLLI